MQSMAESQQDPPDQIVCQGPRWLYCAQFAVDLLDLVVANDDGEIARTMPFAQVDVLLVTFLVNNDAREFDFDQIHERCEGYRGQRAVKRERVGLGLAITNECPQNLLPRR